MNWKELLNETLENLNKWLSDENKGDPSEIISIRQDIHEPPMLLVAGEFNAGKSTFINALLGEKVLTSDIIPATAVVTKLTYGEKEEVIGHFGDGTTKHFNHMWLEELTAERAGKWESMRHKLSYIELKLPGEILKGLTIVDSPGLNSGYDHHTRSTIEFMKRADEVVWLFNYQNLGTQSELDQLRKIKEIGLLPYGVVNRIDLHDDEEESIEEFLEGSLGRVSGLVRGLIGISAIEALEGKLEKDSTKLEWSNWEAIESIISKVENDKDQKTIRLFNRLFDAMQVISQRFTSIDKELSSAIGSKHKLKSFINGKLSHLITEIDDLSKEYQQTKRLQSHFNKLSRLRSSFKAFEVWMIEYEEINGETNSLILWKNDVVPLRESYIGEVDHYNRSLEMSYENHEDLLREWDEFKVPVLFSKWGLKSKLKENETYHNTVKELEEEREKLSQTREALQNKLQTMYALLAQEKELFYKERIPSVFQKITEWNHSYLNTINQFKEIHDPILEDSQKFIADLNEYIRIVSPLFTAQHGELSTVETYQKCFYLFRENQLIPHFYPEPEGMLDFKNFRKLGEKENTLNKSDPKESFNRIKIDKLKKPMALKINLEQYHRYISTKRTTAIVIVSILSIFAFVFTYEGEPTEEVSNEEVAVYASDSTSDYEDDIVDESDVSNNDEPLMEESWTQDQVEEFYEDMMNDLDDRLYRGASISDSWFSEGGAADYRSYYDEFGYGSLETYDVESVDYVADKAELSAIETYELNGEINTYNVQYVIAPTLNTLEITGVQYNLIDTQEQEYSVSEVSLTQFIRDFRSDYLSALNQTDFTYISSYLIADSSASQEIEDYIDSIYGKGYQFDFLQDNIQAVEQVERNSYHILTSEEFNYDKGNGDRIYYQKSKKYKVRVIGDELYAIEMITNLETNKEKIIERTIDYVDHNQVSLWMTSFYGRFIEALNEYGFDYIEADYDPNSEEYSETESYVEYVQGRDIITENQDVRVVNVREHSDTELAIDIYTEDRFYYPEGDGDDKKIEATYIVSISNEGEIKIRDLVDLNILEEIEFIWREEE
ncbi:dynamin family protein [Pseudalkalibacillus hwajinpoensis]|uniref:GTP-binding protein n=1 Tax=Guptibacillus hwajinpoensis TaxID=208199 RepID=A0A4U1MJV6_9BACL|nr:dynamin family protein [Pseudalkalibacillus hwajinpoensis]TKD70762.1 hypothetical protein FBF83_09110 [Pseudalkalibacillus hwajinpoensis]